MLLFLLDEIDYFFEKYLNATTRMKVLTGTVIIWLHAEPSARLITKIKLSL